MGACAVICRKTTFTISVSAVMVPMPISSLPGANPCLPEHKIEVFVRFWGLEPSFSGFSSTKSAFLCSGGGECGIVKRNRGDAYHFAVAPTPLHLCRLTYAAAPAHQHTSTSAPAHQLQRTTTSTSAPATAPQQWHQAPSSAVLAPCIAVHAP